MASVDGLFFLKICLFFPRMVDYLRTATIAIDFQILRVFKSFPFFFILTDYRIA